MRKRGSLPRKFLKKIFFVRLHIEVFYSHFDVPSVFVNESQCGNLRATTPPRVNLDQPFILRSSGGQGQGGGGVYCFQRPFFREVPG